jgi:hypothetical protein
LTIDPYKMEEMLGEEEEDMEVLTDRFINRWHRGA